MSTDITNPSTAAAVLRHVRQDIQSMSAYTPGEQLVEAVKLNTNECPWGPSPAVLAALGSIPGDALRRYPDPISCGLREAAAAAYGVPATSIIAGNGSDDCLTMIYRTFLAPGDRVACPWPTYGLYQTLASLQQADLVPVDFRIGADLSWHLPQNLARQAAKLVILANPNNPSGTLVGVDALRRLADQIDGILVVDEAYIDFATAAGAQASVLPALASHPNLIVLRTFSKSYSLAGARLGLLFAHPCLITQMGKVKDSYNVNVITQRLGIAALGDGAYHRELVRRTLAGRQILEQAFAGLGWRHPPSAANFLLCTVGPRAQEIYGALKAQGILVRWWDRPGLSDKLRISVGTEDQIGLLLDRLRSLV